MLFLFYGCINDDYIFDEINLLSGRQVYWKILNRGFIFVRNSWGLFIVIWVRFVSYFGDDEFDERIR